MTLNDEKLGSKILHTIEASLVGLAAGAAGAYFLYGSKKGGNARKNIKGWSLRMKGEILEKLENLKEMNQEVYQQAIDGAAVKYRKLKSVNADDLEKEIRSLKNHWRSIYAAVAGKKGNIKNTHRENKKK